MSSTFAARVKAHMPVIFDYIGLGIKPASPSTCHMLIFCTVTCIALLVYSSETLASHRPSPIFSIVFSSLVLGHFLVPVARRTPILYGLLLVIGVVSTVFYALG